MDLRSYMPAISQHGLITHRQAMTSGLLPSDIAKLVRQGIWIRVRKGVYADRAVWEELDPFRQQPLLRVRAAHLVMEVDGVFSHDSAALLLGIGVPDPRNCLVHVTRDRVCGSRTKAGIKHHGAPYDPDSVMRVGGLEILGPARTALDIGREHGLGPGVAACDAALRMGVSRSSLKRAVEPMRSWPQVRTVRDCVEIADAGSESWLESLGRVLVHELGIGRPETQFGLTDGHRTVWCDIRVGRHIFEVDGQVKYLPDAYEPSPNEVLWAEKMRQDFITGFKLGVSRITVHDVFAGRTVARRRLAREYADTVARFGHSIDDLAPYIVRRTAA